MNGAERSANAVASGSIAAIAPPMWKVLTSVSGAGRSRARSAMTVDRRVGELVEVLRLPVRAQRVAGEQRVEPRLHRRDTASARTCRTAACPARAAGPSPAALPRLRRRRRRRRSPPSRSWIASGHLRVGREGHRHHDRGDLVRRLSDVRPPAAQDLADLLDRVERRREADDRAQRLQREGERRHDAEVPAAAAERPEQVRVRVGGRRADLAVGAHDLRLDQRVDREPVLAPHPAVAAAQRESGDARCRTLRRPARRVRRPASRGRRRPTARRPARTASRRPGSTWTPRIGARSMQRAAVDRR